MDAKWVQEKSRVNLAAIGVAQKRVAPYVVETPLQLSESLRRRLGFEAPVFLKLENLQNTGAFKVRGAANKILSLIESGNAPKHVVCASAGNHAQAVAYVSGKLGIPCTIVMPEGSPLVKLAATQSYGAQVLLHGLIYDDAYEKAQNLLKEITGSVYIHAYEDAEIISGQGTLGIELHHQLQKAGFKDGPMQVVVPVGGGGLISGVATAFLALRNQSKIFGVVSQAAPAMAESFKQKKITQFSSGRTRTLAEGLAVKKVSEFTFQLISELACEMAVADDDAISEAISFLMERSKSLVEGSGAAGVAAALKGLYTQFDKNVPIVFVICGGNIDLNILPNILERGFLQSGRWLSLDVLVEDKPGQLAQLSRIFAAEGANVLEVHHDRIGRNSPLGFTKIRFLMETRGKDHCAKIKNKLSAESYRCEESEL